MRLLLGLLLAAALSLEPATASGAPKSCSSIPFPGALGPPRRLLLEHSGVLPRPPSGTRRPLSRALEAVLILQKGLSGGRCSHLCPCLCVHPPVPPPVAAARALSCHQCKGFGGCLHPSTCPWGSNYCVSIATRVPFSVIDMPLVTKSCYSGCPDIATLGLGPHVSIVCCQFSLCNTD
nr:secreted Ly-6/uPAR domain-containing protein 2 [Vulpes vulpes]